MQEDIRTVGPRIRGQIPGLTPKEQEIAHDLLNRGSAIRGLTVSEVGHAHDVSDAMIVKLSKKLGYSGYRELRDVLYNYSQLTVNDLHEEVTVDDTPETIVHKVFQTSMQALQETLAILDVEAFKRAVDVLVDARQRDFYGVGGSAYIAADAYHKFLRIGIRATAYADSHLMLMSASLLTPADMVLAVSHSGQTHAILDSVRLAKQNGATVVALTNYLVSTLAQEADIVLYSTARGSPLTGENAAARVAMLNIVDALFVSVAQRNYAQAEENLDRTMSSVTQKRES